MGLKLQCSMSVLDELRCCKPIALCPVCYGVGTFLKESQCFEVLYVLRFKVDKSCIQRYLNMSSDWYVIDWRM